MVPEIHMVVTKADGVASVVAGTSTTYTISADQIGGPSTAPAGVVVLDPVPAGTVDSESEPNCVIRGGEVHVHHPPIRPLGSVSYQLTLFIPPGDVSVTVANTASITANPVPPPPPPPTPSPMFLGDFIGGHLAISKTDLLDFPSPATTSRTPSR